MALQISWLICFSFAQHLKFEGVERRSEAYGISNALTGPLRERNGALMAMASRRLTERNQHSSVARTTTAQMTALNMDSKENVDMAFELNVPSGMDVQVKLLTNFSESIVFVTNHITITHI